MSFDRMTKHFYLKFKYTVDMIHVYKLSYQQLNRGSNVGQPVIYQSTSLVKLVN